MRPVVVLVLVLALSCCTTVTTLEVGACSFYISESEPVTLTYEVVSACRDAGLEVDVRLVSDQ